MDNVVVKDSDKIYVTVVEEPKRFSVSVAEQGPAGPAGPQGQSANLVPATNTTLGGVIVGDNLSITGNGVLSVANTFQPKLANTTYGLTDTGIRYYDNEADYNYYVNGEFVTSGLTKSYIGLRGIKQLSTGTYFDPEVYAVGNYRYNENGTLALASSLEFREFSTTLVNSGSSGFSTLILGSGNADIVAGSCLFSLGSQISGRAGNAYLRLRGNLGGTGDNIDDYQFMFGPSSFFDRGISFEQVARKSTIGFPFIFTKTGVDYKMTNGFSFDNSFPFGFFGYQNAPKSYTSLRHTADAVISGVRTGTEIRAEINKVELLYLNATPVYTANSILTQGYADTRYLASANLTYANLTDTPTTLAGYGITDGLTSANLTPYLTTANASTTYAPVSNGTTYADWLTVKPIAPYLTAFKGEVLKDVENTAGSTGKKLSYLNGVVQYSGFPNIPYATVTGVYTDKANATELESSRMLQVDYREIGLYNRVYQDSVNYTCACVEVRSNYAKLRVTDTSTSTNLLLNTSGLYYDVPITPVITSTSVLNKAQLDAAYLPLANFTYANVTGKPTLATVATTGSYTDLTNTPASYTLPMASASTLGGVRIGSGISVDQGNGFLNTDVRLTTNTFTGSQNLGGNLLTQAKLQAYRETSTAPTISAGSLTLDLSGSNFFAVSLNAAISTITISNIPSGSVSSFTLEFTGTGTLYSVNWVLSSGVIKWAGAAAAPTITATSGKKDVFCFYTTDGGANWLGFIGGQNY